MPQNVMKDKFAFVSNVQHIKLSINLMYSVLKCNWIGILRTFDRALKRHCLKWIVNSLFSYFILCVIMDINNMIGIYILSSASEILKDYERYTLFILFYYDSLKQLSPYLTGKKLLYIMWMKVCNLLRILWFKN